MCHLALQPELLQSTVIVKFPLIIGPKTTCSVSEKVKSVCYKPVEKEKLDDEEGLEGKRESEDAGMKRWIGGALGILMLIHSRRRGTEQPSKQ